jgi:hypothetical protein
MCFKYCLKFKNRRPLKGFKMELMFICPVRKKDFSTSRWRIPESLQTVSDRKGNRKLEGIVEVYCPFCLEEHTFQADEIPCPLAEKNKIP